MLSSATYSSAQSLYHNPEWLLPPHQISFTPSGASANASAVSGGNYSVANGAFDEQGNLLFYVKDGSVYNAANGFVGLLLSGLNPEVAIVPKPGTCDQYYLISWETQAFIGTDLVYATVTVSGGAVSLSGTTKLSGGFIHMNGLAVSDPINGEMERYLYAVSEVGIDQYHINSGGIDFVQVIADQSDFNDFGVGAYAHDTPEAELAGNCIAWGSVIGDPYAFVAIFHPNTFALQNILTLPLPHEDLRVAGIEFANSGDRVYVSTYSFSGEFTDEAGVYFFDAADEFQEAYPCRVEGEERYSKTHLEKARDGNIYLVSESGKLSYFHPSQNDISVSPLNITLGAIGSFVPQDLYTLPDQMDDDDYGSFTGYPAALITDLDVNGLSVDPALPTPPEFFTCNDLAMNTATANVFQYRIILTQLSGSSTGIKYNSGWQLGSPSVSQNLKNLPIVNTLTGGSGDRFYLNNSSNTGDFQIDVAVRNECEIVVSEETGEFTYSTPTAPGITSLDINGDALDPDVPPAGPTPPDVFDCNPALLNITATGAEHRIWVYEVNPTTGDQVITTGAMNYTPTAWLPGVPGQVDLLTLVDGAGVSLNSNAGSFAVEVWVRDECSAATEVSQKGQFEMSSNPTPASIVLTINDGSGNSTSASACTSPTTPCTLAATSGSFSLGNSTGVIDYYRIDEIVQVTCGTNTVLSTIHTETSNNTNFSEVVNARNFNNITVSSTGQQGYFQANALGNCYRVTMTVGNVCGESSITAYLEFDTQFRLANPNQPVAADPSVANMSVKVWPNPANSNALVEYQLPVEGLVRMDLMDAHGRTVATPIQTYQPAGGHRRKLDLNQIPAGIYQWRIVAGNDVQQGRLIKQ